MINNLEEAVDMFFAILDKGYAKKECFTHVKRQCSDDVGEKLEDFLYQELLPFSPDKSFCSDRKCRNIDCDKNYRYIWSRGGFYKVSSIFAKNCKDKR